ncbi:50S ribosomal protein L9 [Dermacoccaceae bacterium W4C1]
MKVILTHEVSKLGTAGDVVDVKDGYARNFLLPRNLATPWTKGGQKQVEAISKARETRAVKTLEEAQSIKGNLESKVINVSARAGATGRLFGAVTSAEIADAVTEAGAGTIDRRRIEITTPIRSTGSTQVQVRLHPDVVATLKLNVVPAK